MSTMIHDITEGLAHKRSKRKGRGDSSGKGKTAGKGTKGTKARGGKYIRRGYEGGQTEIYKRFPKRGFSNADFERHFFVVNLADLEAKFDAGATVDQNSLIEKGLVPGKKWPVKILGNGEIKKKLTVQAAHYSKSAVEKLTTAGGTAQNAKGQPFAFKRPKPVAKPVAKKA
jgi:large subunit ribosomal protein L15